MKDEIELLEVKAFKTKDGFIAETVEDAFKHVKETEFNIALNLFINNLNQTEFQKLIIKDFLVENKNQLKQIFDLL